MWEYYRDDKVVLDFNFDGPEPYLPLPVGGFCHDIGNAFHGFTGNDTAVGYTLDDWLVGGTGNDWMSGGTENDTLEGGAGNDKLYGGTGTDTFDSGLGDDTYRLEDTTDTLIVGLNGGTDTVQSLLATTTLGANLENLTMMYAGQGEGIGNSLGNAIKGTVWSDLIDGLSGNDSISASFGNDTVRGGEGNDQVRGGNGNDVLLYGEAGADRFAFVSAAESTIIGSDRVMDFSARADDKIDLSAMDANTTLVGNQAFSFVGAPTMFSGAGNLYTTGFLLGTLVQGDLNGDGMMDFSILMSGTYAMTASDFIL